MSTSERISDTFNETNSRYMALITAILQFAIAALYTFQRYFIPGDSIGSISFVIAIILSINAIFLLIGMVINNRKIISVFSVFSLAGGWLCVWLAGSSYTFLHYSIMDFSNYSLLMAFEIFSLFSPSSLLSIGIIVTSLLTLHGYGQLQLEDSNPSDGLALVASIVGMAGIFGANIVGSMGGGISFVDPLFYVALLIGPIILLIGMLIRQRLIVGTGSFLSIFTLILGMILFSMDAHFSETGVLNLIVIVLGGLGVILSIATSFRVTFSSRWGGIKIPEIKTPSRPASITKSPTPEPRISQITTHTTPSVQPEPTRDSDISVTSGYDIAGESLKLGVKISNTGQLAILNVTVNLDVPDGFEFDRGTLPSQKLGNVAGGSYQSAIFWLKPQRCVDDEYGGSVIFRDASNATHTVEIPRKRIVNVCPMLESTERADDVFKKLKFGSLKRNCASFKFNGNPKTAFALAETRLKGLNPVDRSEDSYSDGTYLGYSCYVGETKFGEEQFAAEIQASGTDSAGVLTLSVYSDDERILSGFFADIMPEVREHIEVLEEQVCPIATCPKCGADIDPTSIGDDRVYKCSYCGAISKVAPWLA